MDKHSLSSVAQKAMEATLSTTATLSESDARDYLTAVIVSAISMLRTADESGFLYGFLRSALASLGQPVTTLVNPHGGLDVSVHLGATLANPEAFNSVDELRRELASTNEQLIERDIMLADQKAVLEQLLRDVAPIALAHYKKDATQVKLQLDEFCRRHLMIKPAPDAVH